MKYELSLRDNTVYKIGGKRVHIRDGFDFIAHKGVYGFDEVQERANWFNITEISTGLSIGDGGNTIKNAKKSAIEKLNKYSDHQIKLQITKKIKWLMLNWLS
jgi:hypothetical protein